VQAKSRRCKGTTFQKILLKPIKKEISGSPQSGINIIREEIFNRVRKKG